MLIDKWDYRFLDLAKLVSTWSKDPSTKTGAVIVDDKRVVSVGFNGFPAGMSDDPELYENREEKYSRIVHCEVNALIYAKEPVHGYMLYTWPFLSCDRCVVEMIQAGIVRFVAPIPSEDALSRWSAAFERTKRYITEAGGEYEEIDIIGGQV